MKEKNALFGNERERERERERGKTLKMAKKFVVKLMSGNSCLCVRLVSGRIVSIMC